MQTKLLIATTNPGKISEIQHELAAADLLNSYRILTLKDLPPDVPDCVEDRPTFLANAAKKARHFAKLANCLALADDSGLCVDALHGAPGVYSARYAAAAGTRHDIDQANNQKLLAELQNIPDENRAAQFVCTMALALPDADLAVMIDQMHGRILRSPRGHNGFGYDPLFLLPQFNKTTAELTTEEKSKVSHRGKALRRMIQWLTENPLHKQGQPEPAA